MKKILPSLVIALMLGLAGCKKEPFILDEYRILNASSTEITIKNYGGYSQGVETVIPVPGVYPDVNNGYSLPLVNYSFEGYYCTISNGERIVTQRFDDNDDLYMESSYTLIREDVRGTKTFLYIITDDFFADGEPITPAEPQ